MASPNSLRCLWFKAGALVLCGSLFGPLSLADSASAADPFREAVIPFVKTYCAECHNETRAEAELNLMKYTSAEMAADDYRQWEHVITFVKREEMPPKKAQQPPAELRAELLKVVRSVLDSEGRKLKGDPGVVLPRRLSNAEYDHTIRDLTGVDMHPTRSFPVDPAAGEGFDNTGEALRMSPSLFAKQYAAAQHVADHALLTTTGMEFAPYPVTTYADRKKFYEQAILQFYEAHAVDYEKYLTACWEYRYRLPARKDVTAEAWAREKGLSPKYFHSLYELLQGDGAADSFSVGWLRRRWNSVPAPKDAAAPTVSSEARDALHRLAEEANALGKALCPRETEAIVASAGNAPIEHLQRRRKTAAERNTFAQAKIQPARRLHRHFNNLDKQAVLSIKLSALLLPRDAKPGDGYALLKGLTFSVMPPDNYNPKDDKQSFPLKALLEKHAPEQLARLKLGQHPLGDKVDADACVVTAPGSIEFELPMKALEGKREIHFYAEAELDRAHTKSGLVSVSILDGKSAVDSNALSSGPLDPSTLLIDPAHQVAKDVAASGETFCHLFPNRFYFADEARGLTAGFHLIEGFFRDDQPLCQLVLSDDENRELNRLWSEMEFSTEIAERMLRGFVFFERSERNFLKHADFDPFKEEDPKLVELETLNRFEQVYLKQSNVKAPAAELVSHPIHIFFEQARQGLRSRHELLSKAKPVYVQNLTTFARAAYRRPLLPAETEDIQKFFDEVASQPEFGIEQAARASLVRILVSPHFCCRFDPSPAGDTVQPLTDLGLASRLSYFLWSSQPDAELRTLAEAGKLHEEQVLLTQTRRMLKDPRCTDFAREFFGQWLGYRDFLQQEQVDRKLFKEFDESLKQAMFEEPTRLAAHLIQNDRPITELLNSDVTFVDQRLAKHYGLPFRGAEGEWSQVEGLRAGGRGGIMGMAVFLTKFAQPQRTSPVKRGFWVVHKVLGEHIPAPPADVVALPAKETDTNGKTIRQLLALHVEDAKCARCHVRFDSVGLSMEGFDSIGRLRTKDLAGRAVDNVVRLPSGTDAHGVPEFAKHLVETRHEDFVDTFCRKLLGYALGRSLQLSDDVLLEEMHAVLKQNGDRIVPLLETIVRSPQFRNQRCRDFSAARFRLQNQGDGP